MAIFFVPSDFLNMIHSPPLKINGIRLVLSWKNENQISENEQNNIPQIPQIPYLMEPYLELFVKSLQNEPKI